MDTSRYSPDLLASSKDKTYYALTMFPYPSGSGLHCGHASIFTINDVVSRYKRMQGFTVLNPFGFDAFGLPTENYAIQQGKPAREVTDLNKQKFLDQTQALNISFDLERIIDTSEPEYYKRTQWIFAKLYDAGLVYKDTLWVNRCPKDQTVLANDQVVDGKCERCKTEIIQKKHPQWFIKITDYADRLIADLDTVDRPEETKIAQKNWIGRSEGAEIDFKIVAGEKSQTITCFTTRPDTIYGVTALVVAPESTLLDDLLPDEVIDDVMKYRQKTLAKTSVQRQQDLKEKTGVDSGLFALHPFTNEPLPIRYADYVLAGYGSGAVMSVPAHDQRDYEFAKKFGIEISEVLDGEFDIKKGIIVEGYLNEKCDIFTGYSTDEAIPLVIDHLEFKGVGRRKITYKLRDWSVSRQRYWGCPIPIYYDEEGNDHLIPESELPVILPLDLENYQPSGKSPLEDHPSFPRYIPHPSPLPTASLGEGGDLNGVRTKKYKNDIYDSSNIGTISFAKELRKTETNGEKFVRELLRNRKHKNLKRRRQHSFNKYIADFYCDELKLVIEIDGPHHDKQKEYDRQRDEVINKMGVKVERITTDELLNKPAVLFERIDFYNKHNIESKSSPSDDEGGTVGRGSGGGLYTRECDTLDTFMCSSFYFLRFPDAGNIDALIRKELADKVFPIDFYSGGKEHTVGHLLYSRFIHKFLFDQGYVPSEEPFAKLIHQGMVLGADGRKMGKRYGNGIDPTEVVEKYGADAVRTYMMFMGPVESDKPWSDTALNGVAKFLKRVEALLEVSRRGVEKIEVESAVHEAIRGVTQDIENLKLNTCVSKFMILVNTIYENEAITDKQLNMLSRILAPFATDLAERIYSATLGEGDVHYAPRPVFDESKIVQGSITLPIQINGKVRAKIEIQPGMTEEEVVETAKQHENIPKRLEEGEIVKVIWVQDKILNLIVK